MLQSARMARLLINNAINVLQETAVADFVYLDIIILKSLLRR